MTVLHFPWLEAAIAIPLIGAVIISLSSRRELADGLTPVLCFLTLVCTVGEWMDFWTLQAFEAHDGWDMFSWLLNHEYFVIDELSAPLLPLTALLFLMMVTSTLRTKRKQYSFGWTLFSEAILLATLCCREPGMLVGLLIVGVIPPFFELRRRGQSTRVYSLHMGMFAILLVCGWLILPADAFVTQDETTTQTLVAVSLLTVAALIRSGILPFHCWMPDLFERSAFGSALLFVVPMPGAYAIMRLVLPIAPVWALQTIAVLSLVSAVHAAGMAIVQHDTRRFFCYLFLSNSSLVLVGLELVTPIGLTGALCVWLSVGVSLGGFGLALRAIESRKGRISLLEFHGLYEHMPTLAGLFLMTGLASIGFPGTVGFIGGELLVEGAVGVYPLIGMLVVLAAAMNSIAVLKVYFRIFTGRRYEVAISFDARPCERAAVLFFALLILGGGLYPQPGVSSRYHAAKALLERRGVWVEHDTPSESPEHTGRAPHTLQHDTD